MRYIINLSISILNNQNTADLRYLEKTLYHLSIDKAVSYVSELYDLFLLASQENVKGVVPNDFAYSDSNKGVLLFGNNGSGKNVFWRSVATMQIFAQVGLPIPAKTAVLPIYKQIVTQFSESEKEFECGNDAGRFEQEVRELAYMVDNLDSNALVFLNETFQTTAYEEGAEGLYHVLNFFRKRASSLYALPI